MPTIPPAANRPKRLVHILRTLLEDQAEVEDYGDNTVTITGPVDLDELAFELGKRQALHQIKWPPVKIAGVCASTINISDVGAP
jgi:hypothetical protein